MKDNRKRQLTGSLSRLKAEKEIKRKGKEHYTDDLGQAINVKDPLNQKIPSFCVFRLNVNLDIEFKATVRGKEPVSTTRHVEGYADFIVKDGKMRLSRLAIMRCQTRRTLKIW